MSYKQYINANTTILLGNGINRLGDDGDCCSWESIIKELSTKNNIQDIPKGYPLTELFEIINIGGRDIQEPKNSFIEKIRGIEPNLVHYDFIDTCIDKRVNILTTNFDHALETTKDFIKSAERKLNKGFTNYYPWQRYYTLENTYQNIKIWHINGDVDYSNSIKLSVSDYAGCLNHYGRFDPTAKNTRYNKDKTWVNEIMEKDLVIVGLSLYEEEIFLRHILIRRFAQAKRNNQKQKGYYLTKRSSETSSNAKLRFFLRSVGVEMIDDYVEYKDMYS